MTMTLLIEDVRAISGKAPPERPTMAGRNIENNE